LSKTIGVLGGMGPEATADFFVKLIRRTPARTDAEHVRVLIDSNPGVPDRTAFILGVGPNPVDELVTTARNLVKAGADFLAIPCITAHHFIDEIRDGVKVPVLDAVALTAEHVKDRFEPSDAIAILASAGTLRMRLFQNAMADRPFVLPTKVEQERIVTGAIYGPRGVKAVGPHPETRKQVQRYIAQLAGRGAGAVIAGCTEFSVLLTDVELDAPLVDPMALLAEQAVRKAKE